jgi:hypothetical protein
MTAVEISRKLPLVGQQLLLLLRSPRQFVLECGGFTRREPTAKELFGWAVAFGTLVLGLYSLALGSPLKKLTEASGVISPGATSSVSADRKRPVSFAGIAWIHGLGLGVHFPEQRPVAEPQLALFQLGAVQVSLDNVVPENVIQTGTPKILLLLYAFVFVLCIHPVARLFRGHGAFRDAIRLGFIFYAFAYLLFTLVVIAATLLLVDLLHLRGLQLSVTWTLFVVIPSLVMVVRCFFGSFSALYGITRKRLIVVGIGTWLTSAFLCPVIFLPLLFAILRFEALWKLIL